MLLFHLKSDATGVFQDCTISPVLFMSVFQMLPDVLRKFKFSPHAYTFRAVPSGIGGGWEAVAPPRDPTK